MTLQIGLSAYSAMTTLHLDLNLIYLFIQSFNNYLVPLYHRTMAQKTKMINIQWLTNSDIYRSQVKTYY